MSPPRRTLLRSGLLAVTGLAAGCTTADPPAVETPSPDGTPVPDGGGGLPGDGRDGDTGGTRPTGTGGPAVTIVAVDEPPRLPVRPSIKVVESVSTPDHPPQFRVTLTNETDEAVRVGEGRTAFFAYVPDESRDLVFLPAGESYPADADCWRLAESIATTTEYRIVTLDPDEPRSQLLALYGTPTGDGCLPVGEHRFTTTISAAVGTEQMPDAGATAQWGFSILLE